MSGGMRLGLVGAGAIARAYVAAIAGLPTARLVGVADTDRGAAEALADESGARAFGSHLELADRGDCEAVIVATPPVTHAPIVIDLVSRALPVLCEKPLSVDLDGAVWMTRAATENGVILSMASKFRFVDDVIRAREMIGAGEIGTPTMRENVFTGVADMSGRWNADPAVGGGGGADRQRHAQRGHRALPPRPDRGGARRGGAAHAAGRGRGRCDAARAHGGRRAGHDRDLVERAQGPRRLRRRPRHRGHRRGRLEGVARPARAERPLGGVRDRLRQDRRLRPPGGPFRRRPARRGPDPARRARRARLGVGHPGGLPLDVPGRLGARTPVDDRPVPVEAASAGPAG